MNSRQQRKQKQSSLVTQAASHGPYIWRSNDIQSALLWFSCDSRAHTDSSVNETNGILDGCEFLRRLIHSTGIHNPRRKRIQREVDSKNGESVGGTTKKRKRDEAEVSRRTETDDVLSSVLEGYYQLFMSGGNASLSRISHEKQQATRETEMIQDDSKLDINNPSVDRGTNDAARAEMASTQLQHDLNFIIFCRLRTNELYNAALDENQTSQSNLAPKGLQMNLLIDEYMTHPDTAVLRAYASSLYDRYSELLPGEVRTSYIGKLLRLAGGNDKIQQVMLLFLLEPLRRMYIEQMEQSMCMMNNVRSESTEGKYETVGVKNKFAMFPLLCSKLSWTTISAEKIEDLCASDSAKQIIEFILQSQFSDLGSHINESKDCYWSLPSPLLCLISHLYFPLACTYIRHCIELAMSEHDKLYRLESKNDHRAYKPECLQCSSSDSSSFESTMLRIQHISQTSDRLKSLTLYMVSVVQEEYKSSFERDMATSNDSNPSHDDANFIQGLVLDAIRKRLDNFS